MLIGRDIERALMGRKHMQQLGLLTIVLMLANLMDNAVKFTPQNGHIELLCQARADGIHIDISDSGMRISGEDKSKIFDRFYRQEKSPFSFSTFQKKAL